MLRHVRADDVGWLSACKPASGKRCGSGDDDDDDESEDKVVVFIGPSNL